MTDTAALRALIAELESAPGPDRGLDARMAGMIDWPREDVHGRLFAQVVERFGLDGLTADDIDSWHVPAFTASLDAKLPGEEITLAKRLRDMEGRSSRWIAWAQIHTGKNRGEHLEAIATTEPLARRAAALRARLHEMEKAHA